MMRYFVCGDLADLSTKMTIIYFSLRFAAALVRARTKLGFNIQ
jgi:hypothetical protein